MPLEDEITLTLNADELLQELAKVEAKANEVEEVVEEVKETASISFTQVMSGVHASWLATQGIVRAAGGTIPTVFRTVIGTALGTISVLAPLFTAMGATPGMQVQAAIGVASLVLSLGALDAAYRQEKEFSDALRGANMALHGIQSLLGVFDF